MEYIYKIISPSNRIYIGKTKNINKRISYYKKAFCKTQSLLYNSIIKYGWEKHNFEIIEQTVSSKISEREIYWIMYYKSNIKRHPEYNGLNLTDGGENNKGNNIKKVYEYDLEGNFIREWVSQQDAVNFYKMKVNHIPGACKGRLKTFAGKRWSYNKLNKLPLLKNRRSDTKYYNIYQLSKDGKIIKVWNTIGEIVKELYFSYAGVINCINKKRPSYKGYKWILK